MEVTIDNYSIAPIYQKDAWRLCDFVVTNESRLKDYFPKTLSENLTPTLAELFVQRKVKAFGKREEYLFTVKENTNRTIVGLVYVKELHKKAGQGELAYCIGYQYEGKGIMSKIVAVAIAWSFTSAGLSKLQAIIHETNLASKRVVEKNNFEYITILQKEHQTADGSVMDMQLYELDKNNFMLEE